MPRIPQEEKTKLSLNLSKETRGKLDELLKTSQADTYAEVMRKAIDLYGFVLEAKLQGSRIEIVGTGITIDWKKYVV